MELIQGTRKAFNLSTKDDIISSMPDIVITHILNHLPIQDAVRTSILARNWRFKWIMLTQLKFDWYFVEYLRGRLHKNIVGNDNWYDERYISRLFFHLKGPVTKFVLYVPDGKALDDKDFCHWVMFMARKRIKEFTIIDYNEVPLRLPTHIFSCHELTHLTLHNCRFPSTPTCGSFPNLLILDLSMVTFATGFCQIITLCPLLEILKISDKGPITKVKLIDVAKLKNLKMLSLPLRELDSMAITNSIIFHRGRYFPKLQELYLSFWACEVLSSISRKLVCDYFSRVKTLTLKYVNFNCGITLPYAFEIIWGCPNLKNLTIQALYPLCAITLPAICDSALKHITKGQLQLLNVVFEFFTGSENEFLFIKNLLAYTPLLEKITIRAHPDEHFGDYEERFMLAVKLLRLPRASTIAEVDLQRP